MFPHKGKWFFCERYWDGCLFIHSRKLLYLEMKISWTSLISRPHETETYSNRKPPLGISSLLVPVHGRLGVWKSALASSGPSRYKPGVLYKATEKVLNHPRFLRSTEDLWGWDSRGPPEYRTSLSWRIGHLVSRRCASSSYPHPSCWGINGDWEFLEPGHVKEALCVFSRTCRAGTDWLGFCQLGSNRGTE